MIKPALVVVRYPGLASVGIANVSKTEKSQPPFYFANDFVKSERKHLFLLNGMGSFRERSAVHPITTNSNLRRENPKT